MQLLVQLRLMEFFKSFDDVESQGYKVVVWGGDGNMPLTLLKKAPPGSAMRRIYDDKKYIEIDPPG